MPGNAPNAGPQGPEANERLPLNRMMEQYTDTFRRLLNLELGRNRGHEEIQQLLHQIQGQQEALGELTDEQQQDQEFMRKIMVLTSPELENIRTQIIDRLFADLERASPEQRNQKFLELTQAMEAIGVADIFMIHQITQRRIEVVKEESVSRLKNTPAEAIRQGLENIRQNTDRTTITPQEEAFGIYAFSIFIQRTNPALLRQLASPENKNLERFAELTYDPYREFLREKGLEESLFCPDADWYKNLCERTQVAGHLAAIDVQHYPEMTAFNGDIEAQAQEWDRLADEYLLQPENLSKAIELQNRAKGLRDLGKQVRESVETFSIAPAINPPSIDVNLPSLTEVVEKPSTAVKAFFDMLYQPIEWTGSAMDKVSSWIPAPNKFRDLDAGNMMTSAAKLAVVAGGIIGSLGMGVATWNSGGKFLRNLIIERDPVAALKEIPNYLNTIWKSLPSTGATLGAGLFLATREGDLHDLDQWVGGHYDEAKTTVRRVAGHEIFAGAANISRDVLQWIKNKAGPVLELTKEKFDEFIWQNGADLYQDFKEGARDKWKGMEIWAHEVGVNLDHYEKHFETMSSLQDELNAYFRHQGVKINSRTITVSTEDFNQFLLHYIENNQDLQNPQIKEISPQEIKSMKFISDRDFNLLPPNSPVFNPSEALAKRFIEQGLWWKTRLNTQN